MSHKTPSRNKDLIVLCFLLVSPTSYNRLYLLGSPFSNKPHIILFWEFLQNATHLLQALDLRIGLLLWLLVWASLANFNIILLGYKELLTCLSSLLTMRSTREQEPEAHGWLSSASAFSSGQDPRVPRSSLISSSLLSRESAFPSAPPPACAHSLSLSPSLPLK